MRDWSMSQRIAYVLQKCLRYEAEQSAPSVERIAAELGCRPVQVYKIINGERTVTIDMFPRFFHACGRPRALLDMIVNQCDPELRVSCVRTDAHRLNGLLDDEIEDLTVRLGKLVGQKQAAMEDGRIDDDERAQLRRGAEDMIDISKRLIAELEAMR